MTNKSYNHQVESISAGMSKLSWRANKNLLNITKNDLKYLNISSEILLHRDQ